MSYEILVAFMSGIGFGVIIGYGMCNTLYNATIAYYEYRVGKEEINES